MRRLLKISGYGFSGFLSLVAAYIALLFYPGILFANAAEYHGITVHSDDDLTGIEPILRKIEQALETSEIYDAALEHDIFFGYGNSLFTRIQGFHGRLTRWALGVGPSTSSYNWSLPPYVSNIVTFYWPIIESDSLVYPERGANQSLSRTLAHEIVHTYMMAELGLQRIARTPTWKQEGYADYVAASASILADPGYDIRESVDRVLRQDLSWLRDETGSFRGMRRNCQRAGVLADEERRIWNTCYYLARVMVEYAVDYKGMTFRELMSPEVTEADMFAELTAAYRDGTL